MHNAIGNGEFWDTSTRVCTQSHDRLAGTMPLGGTTRAQLTLLDAWPDANETSHGRSLPLGEVLAARSSVPQPSL
jgi:hypothetical protein